MPKTTDACISHVMVLGESYSRILHYFGPHRRGDSGALMPTEGFLRPFVHVAPRYLLRDLRGYLRNAALGRQELRARWVLPRDSPR